MNDYFRIREALGLFDVSVGLTDDAARSLFLSQWKSPQLRLEFQNELRSALANAAVSWRALLFNDGYEVYEFETEQEARDWVVMVLWNAVRPDEPAPRPE